MPVVVICVSRLIVLRSHAEKAVELLDNLFHVGYGCSWLGIHEPSVAEQEALEQYQQAAHKALDEARRDFARVEQDYEEQRSKFLETHGRKPTTQELLKAYEDEMKETLEREEAVHCVDENVRNDVDEDINTELRDVVDKSEV